MALSPTISPKLTFTKAIETHKEIFPSFDSSLTQQQRSHSRQGRTETGTLYTMEQNEYTLSKLLPACAVDGSDTVTGYAHLDVRILDALLSVGSTTRRVAQSRFCEASDLMIQKLPILQHSGDGAFWQSIANSSWSWMVRSGPEAMRQLMTTFLVRRRASMDKRSTYLTRDLDMINRWLDERGILMVPLPPNSAAAALPAPGGLAQGYTAAAPIPGHQAGLAYEPAAAPAAPHNEAPEAQDNSQAESANINQGSPDLMEISNPHDDDDLTEIDNPHDDDDDLIEIGNPHDDDDDLIEIGNPHDDDDLAGAGDEGSFNFLLHDMDSLEIVADDDLAGAGDEGSFNLLLHDMDSLEIVADDNMQLGQASNMVVPNLLPYDYCSPSAFLPSEDMELDDEDDMAIPALDQVLARPEEWMPHEAGLQTLNDLEFVHNLTQLIDSAITDRIDWGEDMEE
ncbi:hypothetical protein B0T25DRAFT_512626 [Lasiosphaeria hispida]|uniref:Uncharacterized protein n=1 Tax=Lasiosphaeria hispida TaxID=260671 RepID=A0AAJ0HT56_9PEZI|nr:hypothetical protein B0T25DRAFT_512626 [Lasiosphaeria hispida]